MHLEVTKRAYAESYLGAETRRSKAERLLKLRLQHRYRLRARYPGLKAADSAHEVRYARTALRSLIHALWDDDVGVFERWQLERRRQHADDSVRVAVDRDR